MSQGNAGIVERARPITQDNVTISIDTVFYFTITDPFRATVEVLAVEGVAVLVRPVVLTDA